MMKRSSTIFLQIVVVLFSLGVLAFLLWEPQVEGVNQHATNFEIYFKDPFLAYVYLASVLFFMAMYQVFKVLGYAGSNQIFSQAAVKALRTTKYCAIGLVGFIVVSFLFMGVTEPEDRPPGVFMRVFFGFPTVVLAVAAGMLERILQNAVEMKFENDLTV